MDCESNKDEETIDDWNLHCRGNFKCRNIRMKVPGYVDALIMPSQRLIEI